MHVLTANSLFIGSRLKKKKTVLQIHFKLSAGLLKSKQVAHALIFKMAEIISKIQPCMM